MLRKSLLLFLLIPSLLNAQTWDFGIEAFANRDTRSIRDKELYFDYNTQIRSGFQLTARHRQRKDSVFLLLRNTEFSLAGYEGYFKALTYAGHQSSDYWELTQRRYTAGLTVCPVNFNMFHKNIEMSVGANVQYLIYGQLKGVMKYDVMYYDSVHGSWFKRETKNFNNSPSDFMSKWTVGPVIIFSANRMAINKVNVKPRLFFRYMLSSEMQDIGIRAMQFGFSLLFSAKPG